jgi:hypothetical protein
MAELLKANALVHFAYYRRSRLLLAFALVFLLLTGLSSLPALFMFSGVKSFNALNGILSSLNVCVMLLSAGLGLFIVSAHLRNRSLKMVFTKPCPPSVWLGSVFLTAVAVSLFLNCVVLASTVALSYAWRLPVRAGLAFISLDTFVASVGLIAYLMLLASLAHPAIAVTFAIIFNAELFFSVGTWTSSLISSGNSSLSLRFLDKLFHYLYLALPMVHAFEKKTENIYSSLRVLHGEWKYLLYALGYVLVLSAFCYSLALFALQRRRHI